MALTKEQWGEIKTKLMNPWGTVHLVVDGYNLTIQRRRWSEMRDCLCVFIDKNFDYQWLREDCEIRRRFCQPSTRKVYRRRPGKKEPSKRVKKQLKANGLDLDATVTTYRHAWRSFEALRRHLIKHNTDIALATDEAKEARHG